MAIVQRGSVIQAADAAASDFFGGGVALNSDGTIMAVGAYQWEGANTNQGGVYILDWSGSAWVARGSVLTAADAAASDYFGTSVSLSDDGTILAVGAPNWEGGSTDQGGVYIYDWSGSAWVARGSVLTYGTPGSSQNFGAGVALSADGAILAVGMPGYSGTYGRVVLFDWSGSAWVQRAALVTASDAASFRWFGTSVSLSDSGSILAVGAIGHGPLDSQGAAYVYDWSGSAWTERSTILLASDATSYDYYGAAVSLSADGAILAVGGSASGVSSSNGALYLYDWIGSAWVERTIITASDGASGDRFGVAASMSDDGSVLAVGAASWEGGASDQGGVYVFDVAPDNFATAPTELTMTLSSAIATAPTELTVISGAYAPTSLTVVNPSGIAYAPTALTMTSVGIASAPTALAMIGAGHIPNWTARCVIDGVDVSARLTGRASVNADEGAARVAEVTLLPTAGTVAPLDYVGKEISIDYVPVVGGTPVPQRLFTGRIDTPDYDPTSTRLRLTCVDDLQNRVAALPREVIEGLVGGRYTTAVQGEITDNWDYAKALLSTVPASLDAGPSGGMRVTPWEIGTPWATYGDAELLYDRALVSYPQRSTIINTVAVEFDYRYSRLRQRYTTMGWSGTQVDMRPCGYQYPRQQDIAGAANGTGWTVTLGVYYPAPAAIPQPGGGFVYPPDDAIDMAILYMTQRHAQTVTESYALTVAAPESVEANGELPYTLRGALQSSFDGRAWESALDVEPLMPTGGEQDWAPDATRTDAEYALQTLLDQANVKILGSHRSARVTNAVLCNPDIDLDKRIEIDTTGTSAAGKVASVTHILDLEGGSAITEFSIACFGAGGAGIITPDTLDPPAAPEPATETQSWAVEAPSLSVNTYGVTAYSDALMGLLLNPPETIYVQDIPGVGSQSVANTYYVAGSYPVTGFRVQMPGVADADRNPLEKPVAADYSIVVPSDPITFTVA